MLNGAALESFSMHGARAAERRRARVGRLAAVRQHAQPERGRHVDSPAAAAVLRAVGYAGPEHQSVVSLLECLLEELSESLASAFASGALLRPTAAAPLRIWDVASGHGLLGLCAISLLRANGMHACLISVDRDVALQRPFLAAVARLGLQRVVQSVALPVTEAAAMAPALGGAPHALVALNICNTGADDALAAVVGLRVPLALVVPCCRDGPRAHLGAAAAAAASPPQPPLVGPARLLLRHSPLRDRYSDALCDSLRAEALRLLGFTVTVTEFAPWQLSCANTVLRVEAPPASAGVEADKPATSGAAASASAASAAGHAPGGPAGAGPGAADWREWDDALGGLLGGATPPIAERLAAELAAARRVACGAGESAPAAAAPPPPDAPPAKAPARKRATAARKSAAQPASSSGS